MKQYFFIYEQIIEINEEEARVKEVEDFVNKYRLNYMKSSKKPEARPIWKLFVILLIVNTILSWNNIEQLSLGYIGITILYIFSYIAAKYHRYNIKEN